MALKPGSNAESPTADDELEVDATANAEVIENPPADPQPQAKVDDDPKDAPPDPAGDPEPEAPKGAKPKPKEADKPKPLAEAIKFLTTPAKPGETPNPAAKKPTDSVPPKATDEAKDENADALTPKPNDDDDDALADWSPEERKHAKGKTKERYRTLHKRFKADEPFANIGREWSEYVTAEGLAPDLQELPHEAMSVAVRTQAAALRVAGAGRAKRDADTNDVALLLANRDAIDAVLGMAGHAPAAAKLDTSKVEITQEVRDMMDAYGVLKSEDELRVVQAALNAHRGKKAAPAKQQPREQQAPPAPPVARAAQQAPSRHWTDEDVKLAQASMADDLVESGVPRERLDQHYQTALVPLITAKVRSLYPGQPPDVVWERISPSNRRELVRKAQAEWSKANPAKAPQPRAPTRSPTPPPVQGTGSRPPLNKPVVVNGKGAVAAAVAHLIGADG